MRKSLLVLFLGLLVGWCSLATAAQIPWKAKINLFSPAEKGVTFENFKGKVLVVNFFATYCPPCQVELLEFSELYREFKPKGVEIISFMVDQGGERLLPHLIYSKNITYYVAIADNEILNAFGWPDLLPTTFLIDREGRIVRKFVGFVGKKTLEEQLSALLKEKTD